MVANNIKDNIAVIEKLKIKFNQVVDELAQVDLQKSIEDFKNIVKKLEEIYPTVYKNSASYQYSFIDTINCIAYLLYLKNYHLNLDKVVSSITPILSRSYYFLGFCFLHEQDLDNAKRNFTKAIYWNPFFPEAHYEIARVFQKKGRLKMAYQEVITGLRKSYHPKFLTNGYNLLAEMFLELGFLEESYICLIKNDQYKKYNDEEFRTSQLLFRTIEKMRKQDIFEYIFLQTDQFNIEKHLADIGIPNKVESYYSNAYFDFGLNQLRQGNMKNSISYFIDAYEIDPQNQSIVEMICDLLEKTKNYELYSDFIKIKKEMENN